MSKTRIEWVRNEDGTQGYTINPVKGLCPMACSYCYARRMYKRFGWNPEIRYEPSVWGIAIPRGSRIFVGSTIELFGDWIKAEWLKDIFTVCRLSQNHTFIFLTKQPQNLPKYSPFPPNAWVGVTATNDKMFTEAIVQLQQIKAKVKYISFEPLLGEIGIFHYLPLMLMSTIQWLIIGQQTPVSDKTRPKTAWIQTIIDAADKAKIPVFVKNNILKDNELDVWIHNWNIQEFPNRN